ncbi:MAG TPA: FAD-binding oxidoreductase, partial [Burkholderiales bacterium]
RMSRAGLECLEAFGMPVERHGYLTLAGPAGAALLRDQHAVQKSEGADIALLGPAALAERFPWLNVSDVALGALGLAGEGWFDGPGFHGALLSRARALGVSMREAEATGFGRGADGAIDSVQLASGERIACRHAVNAAGPWARSLAATVGIGLPVHARRRTVFVLSCPTPIPGSPLVIDPEGFWFRPEGRFFIAGAAPASDADDLPLEPDYTEFDEALWARMAHRVPAFEALRVERAWAGYYEMNVVDGNAILGAHPAVPNLWFANGFSGHGMQHAAAAGRGIAERIVHGAYRSLDLSSLGFERLLEGRPLREDRIIG